jgi:hypothetical protein
MSSPVIKEITVSVSIADKEYGNGTEAFKCLKADYPAPVSLEKIDDLICDGLDLYLAAWSTLLAGRLATGIIKDVEEFRRTLSGTRERVERIRKYMRNHPQGATE